MKRPLLKQFGDLTLGDFDGPEDREQLYAELQRMAAQVLLIELAAEPGLVPGEVAGTLLGFYTWPSGVTT